MPSYTVMEVEADVKRLAAKDNYAPKRIDLYTLEQNGTQTLAFDFVKVDDPVLKVGQVVEGELGDQGKFEQSNRRRFKPPRQGGGGGGAKDAYWERKEQRDIQAQPRIQRSHSQEMALRYIDIKARQGWIEGFDFADVAKMADAFDRDLDPTPPAQPEYPGDDDGLPPARDLG